MQLDRSILLALSLGLTGGSVATFTVWLCHVVTSNRAASGDRYELARLASIRRSSAVYRWFEPLILELGGWLGYSDKDDEGGLAHALRHSGSMTDWYANEFKATKIVEGALVALAIGVFISITGYYVLAICFAIGVLIGYPILAVRAVHAQREKHARIVRGRLPMLVDQLALMIQAGGNFEQSLRTVVAENPTHPLCKELAVTLGEIDAGLTRKEALLGFRSRFPDADIGELVYAINKGEELGTPMSTILSDQAEQMRLKRIQWGEKATAEAEVQIVFPGMLIMIACLIVIIAPILLPAVMSVFG
ncbi:MAG TPA: hypothetical protein DDW52_22005 [Planctomycetaceae bacterium]|nr:hypothetical protein [Planctomycetaceae bacterium]